MEGQELGNRLEACPAHLLRIENAHDDESNPASQGEPPGREAETVSQLGRAYCRTASDHRPRDAPCHQRHPRRPSAYGVPGSRLHRPGMINTDADDQRHRSCDNDCMKRSQIHELPLFYYIYIKYIKSIIPQV